MTPTRCSGVADNQLWTLGRVAERLPKMRNAWSVVPGPGADDRSALGHGRCTDEPVIAAVQVHVAQSRHAVTDALCLDIARLQDAQAGIGRLGALGLSESVTNRR